MEPNLTCAVSQRGLEGQSKPLRVPGKHILLYSGLHTVLNFTAFIPLSAPETFHAFLNPKFSQQFLAKHTFILTQFKSVLVFHSSVGSQYQHVVVWENPSYSEIFDIFFYKKFFLYASTLLFSLITIDLSKGSSILKRKNFIEGFRFY